ncbi:MAG: MCE family protein [Kiritimatiellae bacterium]|nr:MCE family protein [Kiritimatiellia bacterium]
MNKTRKFSGTVLFLISVAASVFGGLCFFGKIGHGRNMILVETYFQCPVNGLEKGSSVKYRGVKIGEVEEISFLGSKYDVSLKDSGNISVLMAVDPAVCRFRPDEVPQKAIERMISGGLRSRFCGMQTVGNSYIELLMPEKHIPEARISWRPDHMLIHSVPPDFAKSAIESGASNGGPEDFDATSALSNILAMAQSASQMCGSMNSLVESERDRVSRILENLDAASSSLRVFAEAISENPSRLIRSGNAEYLPETR